MQPPRTAKREGYLQFSTSAEGKLRSFAHALVRQTLVAGKSHSVPSRSVDLPIDRPSGGRAGGQAGLLVLAHSLPTSLAHSLSIYLSIPREERMAFARYLRRVSLRSLWRWFYLGREQAELRKKPARRVASTQQSRTFSQQTQPGQAEPSRAGPASGREQRNSDRLPWHSICSRDFPSSASASTASFAVDQQYRRTIAGAAAAVVVTTATPA